MTAVIVLGAICTAAMLGIFVLRWPEADRMVRVWDIVKSVIALALVAFLVHWLEPSGLWLVGTIILYVGFVVASIAIVAPFSWGYTPAPGGQPLRAIDRWVWSKGPLRMLLSRKIRKPRSLHNWLAKGSAEGHHRVVWWRGLLAIVLILLVFLAGLVDYFNGDDDDSSSARGNGATSQEGDPVILTGWYQAFDNEAQRKNALEAAFCAKLIDEETFESFANGGTPGDRDRSELFEFFQTMTSSADNRGPQYSGVLKVIVGGNPNLIQSGPEGRDVINPEVVDPDDLKPGDTPVLSTIEVPQAWTFTPGGEGEPVCKLTPVPAGVYYFDPVRKDLSTSLTGGLLMTTGDNLERWRVFTTNPAD